MASNGWPAFKPTIAAKWGDTLIFLLFFQDFKGCAEMINFGAARRRVRIEKLFAIMTHRR